MTPTATTRDFAFTESDYRRLIEIATSETGIMLEAKRELIYGRVSRRLRQLGLAEAGEYVDLVLSDAAEHRSFINLITTNLTSFFREKHHFETLERTVLPALLRARASEKRLRIWSAGCSTGQEPYSLAMVLHRVLDGRRDWDVRILATDIDTDVLAQARTGVYPADTIETVPSGYRSEFQSGTGSADGRIRVRPHLSQYISFRQLNLLGAWPMTSAYDVIFCRNVAIYFNNGDKRVLFDRFADQLRPDGWLFIGHSETLHHISDRFTASGATTYTKVAA